MDFFFVIDYSGIWFDRPWWYVWLPLLKIGGPKKIKVIARGIMVSLIENLFDRFSLHKSFNKISCVKAFFGLMRPAHLERDRETLIRNIRNLCLMKLSRKINQIFFKKRNKETQIFCIIWINNNFFKHEPINLRRV